MAKTFEQIIDHLESVTTIKCTAKSCKIEDEFYEGEDFASEHFFDLGWRATDSHCYCPKHAKKLLK